MSTAVLILVFLMANYVSFRAGINYGHYKLFKALAYLPDELRNEHFNNCRQEIEKATKGEE